MNNRKFDPTMAAEDVAIARMLLLKCGAYRAACYLRRFGWSLEAALWLLCGKESRITN